MTAELCPDCGRPVGKAPRVECSVGLYGTHSLNLNDCTAATIASLRAQLAAAEDRAQLSRDCCQVDVCAVPPGCQRHWQERNQELVERNRELVTERDDVEAALAVRGAELTHSVAREKLARHRADEARALLGRIVRCSQDYVPAAHLAKLLADAADYLQRTHDPNSILREKA